MAGALALACASRWAAVNAPPLTCAANKLASLLERLAPAAEHLAGAAAAGVRQRCRPLTSLPAEAGSPELDGSAQLQAGTRPPSGNAPQLQHPPAGAAHSTVPSSSSGGGSNSSDSTSSSGNSDGSGDSGSSSTNSNSSSGGSDGIDDSGSSSGMHPSGSGSQVTPQALATATAIMARFPAESWDPGSPRLVDVAMQLLQELKDRGASEEEQHAACSDGRRLRALRRRLRLSPCLEALFGGEAAQQLLHRRPALLATTPPNMARALAAMALCGVRDPVALAARSPVLLQYRHDSFSFVAARLAMQQYLGLPDAAAVYQRLPTYLLPSALTVACRLQFLEERGLLPCLVARLQGTQQGLLATLQQAVAAAAQQQQQQQGLRRRPGRPPKALQQGQQQGAQQGQQRGPGRPPRAAPPAPTLSGAVKRGVAEFCMLVGASVEEYRQYEATFERHPAWRRLRDRGQRETAQLRALLQRLEQQVAGAGGKRQ